MGAAVSAMALVQLASGCAVVSPAIGLASTWDPGLLKGISVACEIRARGAQLVLSPVVDVARDPRWGRIEETCGEDLYLVSEPGVAAVDGFRGDTLLLADGEVVATLKRMTGHGQPESAPNAGPANLLERPLREVFFQPFEEVGKCTTILWLMAKLTIAE